MSRVLKKTQRAPIVPSPRLLERFPFRLPRLILQYILYSKNEGKITPQFLLWENHTFNTRDFYCQHRKSPDFDQKRKKY
jgi:hypothetical protein